MNVNVAMVTPGPVEILVILFIILLLFGAKRLPQLSRSLGKSLSEFKRGREESVKAVDEEPSKKVDVEAEGKSSKALESEDESVDDPGMRQ